MTKIVSKVRIKVELLPRIRERFLVLGCLNVYKLIINNEVCV